MMKISPVVPIVRTSLPLKYNHAVVLAPCVECGKETSTLASNKGVVICGTCVRKDWEESR
jgi:hypothetical protein